MLDRSKEEVAQLQARCDEFWHHLVPTQYARDEGYLSQELEWLCMEENRLGSAATGSGGKGTDDTTLIERGEQSSFVAEGDRLPVHLSSSKIIGGLAIDDTTLTEVVEPSSFVVAGGPLACLSSSCRCCMSWAYPDSHAHFLSVPVEEPEQVERARSVLVCKSSD